MTLNILVVRGGCPDSGLAQLGATKAFSLLEELSANKRVITTNITKVDSRAAVSTVVQRMIGAVLQAGDNSLTPLAAVAGAVSDEVGDFLFQQEGVSKVVVNNGGDIAIRLKDGEVARVGINLDYFNRKVSHVLTVSSEVSGVATSGLGGRSFTKGIASAVVVWAPTASLADALATSIGNATDVSDPLIHRQLAQEIYPDTDIPGHLVTTFVGDISEAKVEEALEKGMATVRQLNQQGLIFEALVAVKGQVRMTDGMLQYIGRAEV